MPGMTDYAAKNWLDYITGKTAMPALPTAYLGLFTTAPTSDSGVTGAVEVAGGSYARQSTVGADWAGATNSVGSEPAVAPAYTTNAAAITFPKATANWGTVVAYGIFDALTAGNLQFWDWLGDYPWLPFSCTLASPGVFTVPGSGFANADPVVVTGKYGGVLPTTAGSFAGVLAVAGVAGDSFNVGVNTTAAGEGMIRKILQQAVPAGVQPSFAINALKLQAA